MENSMRSQIISASTLMGADVRTTTDENIGDIKDLMIDTSSGEVSYAVLSVSTGFLNLDSKYFAVPLGAFDFNHFNDDYDGNYLTLDVSKERLENSPGFDKDNWPTHPDFEFVDSVHSYYGMESRRRGVSGADDTLRTGSGIGGSRYDDTRLGASTLGGGTYRESNKDDSLFGDSTRDDSRFDDTDSRRDKSRF
jgi:sporulation protein YlmC with PRC-barrel domain